MSLFRYIFWRVYRKPKVGELWEHCDGERHDPFENDHAYIVLETRRNWALIRYIGLNGTRSVPFQSMIAFYRKKP